MDPADIWFIRLVVIKERGLLKISAPLSLIKALWISLIPAESTSLDSAFNNKQNSLEDESTEQGCMHKSQRRQSASLLLQPSELAPPPHAGGCPPAFCLRDGGTHSLVGEGMEGPNSDKGTDTVVWYVYMFFVV